MNEDASTRGLTLSLATKSITICAVAIVASWFVVSRLWVWFDNIGLIVSVPLLTAISAWIWIRSQSGQAWVIGTCIGAFPSVLVFWIL